MRPDKFSPVSELLPRGSQTDAVLQAAADASDHRCLQYEEVAPETKEGYISQVRLARQACRAGCGTGQSAQA